MKILNISTYDTGGAGRAALRITDTMNLSGLEAKMLVREKRSFSDSDKLFSFCTNKFTVFWSKVLGALNQFFSSGEVMYEYFGFDISNHKLVKEADVLVIHWTGHFLSYRSLRKLIATKKPVVFFMHDMWLLTGGCHIDRYCGLYKNGCGNCPQIQKKNKDSTAKNFRIKKDLLSENNVYIVSPSQWLKNAASESNVFSGKTVEVINNPVDVSFYDKIENISNLKRKFGLSENKNIILYGAMSALKDSNKGFSYLKEALKYLPKDEFQLALYGNDPDDDFGKLDCECVKIGKISDDKKMLELINCSDLVVLPSNQENYSLTVLESMSCGKPVVAFDIGGNPEMVLHKKNGYVARFKDCEDLAKGICFCGENKDLLGAEAYSFARKNNSYEAIGLKFKEYLEKII